MQHLHENINATVCISARNLATASVIGGPIDTRGYGGVEFIVEHGTRSASTVTVTTTVMESTATTASTFTSVADGDLVGLETDVSLAAVAISAGVTSACTKRIGYKGQKRYVTVDAVQTGVTSVGCVGITALLHNPGNAPTTNP